MEAGGLIEEQNSSIDFKHCPGPEGWRRTCLLCDVCNVNRALQPTNIVTACVLEINCVLSWLYFRDCLGRKLTFAIIQYKLSRMAPFRNFGGFNFRDGMKFSWNSEARDQHENNPDLECQEGGRTWTTARIVFPTRFVKLFRKILY